MISERRSPGVAGLAVAALLVSSCAARTVRSAAVERGDALGLDVAEREAFTREVEACLGAKPVERQGAAPSATVAIGASGEAPIGSAGGLAAVGAVATAVAAGMVYRAYHWWRRNDLAVTPADAGARPPHARASADAIAPAPGAGESGEGIAAARGDGESAAPIAAARGDREPVQPTLDSCLDTVTERWRGRLSAADIAGS